MRLFIVAMLALYATPLWAGEGFTCGFELMTPNDQGVITKIVDAYSRVIALLEGELLFTTVDSKRMLESKSWFKITEGNTTSVQAAEAFRKIAAFSDQLAPDKRGDLEKELTAFHERNVGKEKEIDTGKKEGQVKAGPKVATVELIQEFRYRDAASQRGHSLVALGRNDQILVMNSKPMVLELPHEGYEWFWDSDHRIKPQIYADQNGRFFAVRSSNQKLLIYEMGKTTPKMVIDSFEGATEIFDVQFSETGDRIVVSSKLKGQYHAARVFDISKTEWKQLGKTIDVDPDAAMANASLFVVGDRALMLVDAAYSWIDLTTGKAIKTMNWDKTQLDRELVHQCTFLDAKGTLFSYDSWGKLTKTKGFEKKAVSAKPVQVRGLPKNCTSRTAVPESAAVVLTEALDEGLQGINVVDAFTKKVLGKFEVKEDLHVGEAALSHDRKLVAIEVSQHWKKYYEIYIWRMDSPEKPVAKIKAWDGTYSMYFSEDGKSLYYLDAQGLHSVHTEDMPNWTIEEF